MYGPASSTITSSPASATIAAVTAPPAPDPTTTTSHSSPPSGGSSSPSGAGPGSGLRGGQRPDAGRHRLRERAQGAKLSGAQPRLAPSRGRGSAADPARDGPQE